MLPQPSIFPQGYNKQSEDLPANLKVDNGIFSLTPLSWLQNCTLRRSSGHRFRLPTSLIIYFEF